MEKEGKKSANVELKAALGVVGASKFEITLLSKLPNGELFMGYRDYTDTMAVRESWKDENGKKHSNEIRYTEEVRINQKGEEYIVHVCDFEDEEYYDCTSETQWDGRTSKAAKEIDGLLRFTPKDVVRCFYASNDRVIREYNNNLIYADMMEKANKAKQKASKKTEIIKDFNKTVRTMMRNCKGMTQEMAEQAVLVVSAKDKKAIIMEYMSSVKVVSEPLFASALDAIGTAEVRKAE